MSPVFRVLIIPAEGVPLLAIGPCGAKPPMAWLTSPDVHEAAEDYATDTGCCRWCGESWPCADAGKVETPARWHSVTYPGITGDILGEALVLAWESPDEFVHEGMDRAYRTAEAVCPKVLAEFIHDGEEDTADWSAVQWGRFYEQLGLGTVVLLGADRREVT